MNHSSNSDPDELRREIARWVPIMPGHFDVARHENTVDGIMTAVNQHFARDRQTLLSETQDELEEKLGFHPPNEYSPDCSQCQVLAILKRKKEES